ncbi:MAG: tRNA-binding protein [Legionella sp.]|jgi:tRNA-binding protein
MQHTETSEIQFDDFLKVDIRAGTILEASPNPKAHKPAYILKIDFGDMGIKTSSAQITENYQPEQLIGKQIVAVMNFPAKRVAGIKSEVLVLGCVNETSAVVLLQPSHEVINGSRIL